MSFNLLKTLTEDQESDILHHIASKLKASPSGEQRVVLRMSLVDLKRHYLQEGGGVSWAKNLPNENISAILSNPVRATEKEEPLEFEILLPKYTFGKLITPKEKSHEVTVLLDIPNAMINELKGASSTNDINAGRIILEKMMNHKFTVFTINNARAKKIEGEIKQNWNNLDDLIRVFNPGVIIAIPDPEELKQAHDAFVALTNSGGTDISEPEIKSNRNLKKLANFGSKNNDNNSNDTPEEHEDESDQELDAQEATSKLNNIWNQFVGKNGELDRTRMTPEMKTLLSKMYKAAYPVSASKAK
jgi:hypothetical protein